MFRAVIICGRDDSPLYEEILFAIGASSVSEAVVDDETAALSALFSVKPEDQLLHENFPGSEISIELVHESEWKDIWKKHFTGAALTSRVYALPDDGAHQPPDGYEYNAGDAFGDGNHPTTSMCALLTEIFILKSASPSALKILDIGTGSGILAIYCSLHKAEKITALDISDESIQRARLNAALNKIDRIKFILSGITEFETKEKFDLVIANLQSALIEDNIHQIASLGETGAAFIFSGIGTQWMDGTRQIISRYMDVEKTITSEEWAAFACVKK